jgi:fructokinase
MILGIGELLWDVLPTGPRIGGAPANFAGHASSLGADAAVISRVGADADGGRLVAALRAGGVSTAGVTVDPDHPTGSVDVRLGPDGQPEFTIHEDVAWDHLGTTPGLLDLAASADAVCFGSLGQRSAGSRAAIRKLVAATPPGALRVFDVNLRQRFYDREVIDSSLELANVCKLSDSELPLITGLLGLTGDVRGQLATLLSRYRLRAVVYTRGADGSLLTDGTVWSDHPGVPTEVRDTVGAGDSFTCAVTLGLLQGWPLAAISETASGIAAYVCSQDGAVPPLPPHFRERFTGRSDGARITTSNP